MTGARALGAIDVGTNSVHMVIARPVPGGSPEILARERVPVRLGTGGDDMKLLMPDAVERAVTALVEFRHIADAHDADVVAVATSAVREADNQGRFLRRVHDEARITVEIVSGMEEARLIHLGAMSAVPIAGRPHIVIDIGGGSTELIVGDHAPAALARSLKLGHMRLTDRFFDGGVIADGAVKACRRHIKSFVAHVAGEARDIGFEVAVGCSGTIAAVATLCAARRGETLRTVANATIERSDLNEVVADLISRPTPGERAGVPGLDPARRDVIVAGAILLRQLFKALGIESLVVSTGSAARGAAARPLQPQGPLPRRRAAPPKRPQTLQRAGPGPQLPRGLDPRRARHRPGLGAVRRDRSRARADHRGQRVAGGRRPAPQHRPLRGQLLAPQALLLPDPQQRTPGRVQRERTGVDRAGGPLPPQEPAGVVAPRVHGAQQARPPPGASAGRPAAGGDRAGPHLPEGRRAGPCLRERRGSDHRCRDCRGHRRGHRTVHRSPQRESAGRRPPRTVDFRVVETSPERQRRNHPANGPGNATPRGLRA